MVRETPSQTPATAHRPSFSALRSGLWLVCGALALTSLPAVAVAQQPADGAERPAESPDRAAERLNEEGKKLVAQGKYEDALDKFRESLRLFPLSNAIFNIGSMLYTLKRYEEAFPFLEYTLRAPLDPRQREVVIQYRDNVLEQLRPTHAAILVESSPPGATVTLNNTQLPFEVPARVLIPYGTVDIKIALQGFKPQTIVVTSSRAEPPKDMRVRLERDDPDAQVTVFCPKGADIFIDGIMVGYELVRTKLLLGDHTVRCGKTQRSKAFERTITVRNGPNTFEFSKDKQ